MNTIYYVVYVCTLLKFLKMVLKSIKRLADTQHRHTWHCYWQQVSLLQLSTRWWCAFFIYKYVTWTARMFNVLTVGESQVRYIRSSKFPRSRWLGTHLYNAYILYVINFFKCKCFPVKLLLLSLFTKLF